MRYLSDRIVPGAKPPVSIVSDEARRPIGAEDGTRRRAAASTDGEARFVGNCDTDESAAPQSEQKRADPATSDPQVGQRVNVSGF